MNLVTLTQVSPERGPVLINLDKIIYMFRESQEPSRRTKLFFDKGCYVYVDETPEEILNWVLRGSLKPAVTPRPFQD